MRTLSIGYLSVDCLSLPKSGAGSGNRTRTLSLEGSYDTISPYPHFTRCVIRVKISVKHITKVKFFQGPDIAAGATVDFMSLDTFTKSRFMSDGVFINLEAPTPFSPSHKAQLSRSMNKGIR